MMTSRAASSRSGASPPVSGSRRAPRSGPPPAHARHRTAFGRVLGWSILLSASLHLAVLLVSPAFLRVGLPPGQTDSSYQPVPQGRLQMVAPRAIVPVVSPTAPAEGRPVRSARAEEAAVPVPSATAPRRADDAPAGTPGSVRAEEESAAEGLRPGYRDPRLWITKREAPPPPEPSDHERYMEHLTGRIEAYNDSVYAVAARKRKATDWTIEDGSGNRWGLSPEGIHLGPVTLPPLAPGMDPVHRETAAEERRQREEIIRQEESRERERTREERVRETRERKDAERADRERDDDGSG